MPSLEYFKLHRAAIPPVRAYGASAAWDLSALLANDAGHLLTATVAPQSTKLIRTGLVLRPPPGCFLLVCSRSGLATRSVFVANAPGVIDPDYIGEIGVLLFNGGLEPHYLKNGDRIAQVLILPLVTCPLEEVHELPKTERGERGFGSTGS